MNNLNQILSFLALSVNIGKYTEISKYVLHYMTLTNNRMYTYLREFNHHINVLLPIDSVKHVSLNNIKEVM